MNLIDEVIGYAKANAEAAQTTDDKQTWLAHQRNCEALRGENERLRAALTEITEGKGRYSMDRLEHASNTIDDMKEIARKALNGTRTEQAQIIPSKTDLLSN